ncbi:hypothetical protein [Caulobacter hibisci]|uniref:Uncharacterized protein n=1 Tax=Caulobacter hibisci TaxID=2035993 RepID=A0ABS0T0E3_9CAUL|nr:hypothetical protein [Caulobacter hibisci]MBI1685361.1 hypothetical protein [Caulobacter hibisci]
MRAFDAALADLYAAFDTTKPRVIHGCPCCVDKRNTDILLAKPLRQLTGDDLGGYASGVFLTVGSENDYLYLLPRMFEITATEKHWQLYPQLVVGHLRFGDRVAWKPGQRRALSAFLDAWFDRQLDEIAGTGLGFHESDEVEALLCGLAIGGVDIATYLDRLKPVGLLVTDLYWRFGEAASEDRGPPNYWEDAPEGWAAMKAFMNDPEIFAIVARVSGIFPTR